MRRGPADGAGCCWLFWAGLRAARAGDGVRGRAFVFRPSGLASRKAAYRPLFSARRFFSPLSLAPFAHLRPRTPSPTLFSRRADLPSQQHPTPTAFVGPRHIGMSLFARPPDGHATPPSARPAASRYARRGRCLRGLLRGARHRRRRRFSNRAVGGAVARLWANDLTTFGWRRRRRSAQRDQKQRWRAARASWATKKRRNFFFKPIFQKQS